MTQDQKELGSDHTTGACMPVPTPREKRAEKERERKRKKERHLSRATNKQKTAKVPVKGCLHQISLDDPNYHHKKLHHATCNIMQQIQSNPAAEQPEAIP